jgi:hypothetical protein
MSSHPNTWLDECTCRFLLRSLNNCFLSDYCAVPSHPLRFVLMRTHYRSDVNHSDSAIEIASDPVYYIYQVLDWNWIISYWLISNQYDLCADYHRLRCKYFVNFVWLRGSAVWISWRGCLCACPCWGKKNLLTVTIRFLRLYVKWY